MLEIMNLCSGYGGKEMLHDISLTAKSGQVTVIIGPNGCGKSTLLKALCGILPAQSGQILLDGIDLLAMEPKHRARKVAYLAQSRQMPDITARRLVLHGRFPYLGYPRRYRKEDYVCVDAAMERMGISDLAEAMVETLSGGQRQKAYIAMALAQETPVILLDEPTTYLDIQHQLQLMKQARELTGQGKTVVMILHDLPHALRTADHLVLMDDGVIVKEGTPEELYQSGALNAVFGITLGRTPLKDGWHYYCQEEL